MSSLKRDHYRDPRTSFCWAKKENTTNFATPGPANHPNQKHHPTPTPTHAVLVAGCFCPCQPQASSRIQVILQVQLAYTHGWRHDVTFVTAFSSTRVSILVARRPAIPNVHAQRGAYDTNVAAHSAGITWHSHPLRGLAEDWVNVGRVGAPRRRHPRVAQSGRPAVR